MPASLHLQQKSTEQPQQQQQHNTQQTVKESSQTAQNLVGKLDDDLVGAIKMTCICPQSHVGSIKTIWHDQLMNGTFINNKNIDP